MPEALDLPDPNKESIPQEPEEESIPIPPIPKPVEVEPISLVDEGDSTVHGEVKAFGAAALKSDKKTKFKRPLNVNKTGATRFKIFHSKIAIASLENMEQIVNDWLDSEEIEVKHADTVIGTMTGKTPEPNIILGVWY